MGILVLILDMSLRIGYANSVQAAGSKIKILLSHAGVKYQFDNLEKSVRNEKPYLEKPFPYLLKWQTEIKPALKVDFPLVNLPYCIDSVNEKEIVKVGGEFPVLNYLAE